MNTFTETCNASLQTVRRVTMCPSNISAYEEAVQKKNCSSLAADAHTCKSFQYHCVLSDDLKYAIEVCAPSIITVGMHICIYFKNRSAITARFEIKSNMMKKFTKWGLIPAITCHFSCCFVAMGDLYVDLSHKISL